MSDTCHSTNVAARLILHKGVQYVSNARPILIVLLLSWSSPKCSQPLSLLLLLQCAFVRPLNAQHGLTMHSCPYLSRRKWESSRIWIYAQRPRMGGDGVTAHDCKHASAWVENLQVSVPHSADSHLIFLYITRLPLVHKSSLPDKLHVCYVAEWQVRHIEMVHGWKRLTRGEIVGVVHDLWADLLGVGRPNAAFLFFAASVS